MLFRSKAKKLAEDSSKTKELFLANMSHEIRTPMNAIMGIIQLLKDTSLDDSQKDYLKSMDFAGENLLRIIDDVLDISKIESGKMSIEQIEFNIREIIESLFSSIKHRATEKGINLLYQIEEKVPQIVIGDPVRLNQILLNLINNAIKFTDKGSVELILKNTSISNKMVGLEFQIRDTGIGIPKNIQELIFLEFEQANKGTTRNFGGTGLGLSIVRKLLKLQGGDIVVESSKGKGATFTFNISYEIPESIKHVKIGRAHV